MLEGLVQTPSVLGTSGQSESKVQEMDVSWTQRPQEAETGGLVGGGVGGTGALVCVMSCRVVSKERQDGHFVLETQGSHWKKHGGNSERERLKNLPVEGFEYS